MKYHNWKWFLPVVQVALALACNVYDVHEYRVGAYRNHVQNSPEYYAQHEPELAERASQGINFPAVVLAYPLREVYNPTLYEYNGEYTHVSIAPREIAFFIGILLFWYWVGKTLGERQEPPGTGWRIARVAGHVFGVIFGGLTGIDGARMIATNWVPWREIGACGVAWAAILIAYFVWRLMGEFTADRKAKVSLAVITSIMLAAGGIWVGGPIGATQALGDYLRPTVLGTMKLPGECTADEALPENVSQIVEAQRSRYALARQRVVVCRTMVGRYHSDDVVASNPIAEGRWLLSKAGGYTYQYRRHFAVLVVYENGTALAEVDLVQSRWDYLRLNWNKVCAAWFWPYPQS